MVSLFDQASLAWEEGEIKTAFELFYEAAEQGDRNSLVNLGYCYDEGVGTKKNPSQVGWANVLWFAHRLRLRGVGGQP